MEFAMEFAMAIAIVSGRFDHDLSGMVIGATIQHFSGQT